MMMHKKGAQSVDVHPAQIETMKRRGWSTKPTFVKVKKLKKNED